jgi:hypothetical protein
MAREPSWTAPAGVTIEDATIRAVPSAVEWELGDSHYNAESETALKVIDEQPRLHRR